MTAHKKNLSAIRREFARAADQSCLNRFLTEVGRDAKELTRRNLERLRQDPSTRCGPQGVIPIDNVLIDHDGKLIEEAGLFRDHAEQRSRIAHDYLIVDYVRAGGKHYPLDFRRFVKREQCGAARQAFREHNDLFRELVDWAVEQRIPGDFTFDCRFTHAANLNHVQAKERGYVGDLEFNRKVEFLGQAMRADAVVASIKPADCKAVELAPLGNPLKFGSRLSMKYDPFGLQHRHPFRPR